VYASFIERWEKLSVRAAEAVFTTGRWHWFKDTTFTNEIKPRL
jgi:hypothetical protein